MYNVAIRQIYVLTRLFVDNSVNTNQTLAIIWMIPAHKCHSAIWPCKGDIIPQRTSNANVETTTD
jgi:hypothetical protein